MYLLKNGPTDEKLPWEEIESLRQKDGKPSPRFMNPKREVAKREVQKRELREASRCGCDR